MLTRLLMIRRRRAQEGCFFWWCLDEDLYVGSGSLAARGDIKMPEIRLVSNLQETKGKEK